MSHLIAQDHQVTLTARLYADEQFPQSATARTIVLTGGAGWLLNPPGAVTNLSLSIPTPGILRGEFQFSGYLDNSSFYPHKSPKPLLGPSGFRVGPHPVRNPSTFPKTFTITAGAGIVPPPGSG
jgi:hypothetical protein